MAVLPRFLSLGELGVLALFFTGLLAWTRRHRQLGGVHAVPRPTAGALVFPAGLFLGAWAGWGHPAAIVYGSLVLALADPAAALVGRRLRCPGWRVAGGQKTLAGSAAFLAVALVLGALLSQRPEALLPVAAAALVLAGVEGSIGYGLDNLPLPLVASVIGVRWLGL